MLSSVALLSCASVPLSAAPGLNAPQAIGPFLNGAFPSVAPTGASEWTVQETYTGININLPTHIMPYPGTGKLLCVAKEGRILLFDDTPGAAAATPFLDLRNQTFTTSDCGMTWLVFHPQFGQAGSPNRGYVYVTYKWKPAGGNGDEAYWRLSRFTVPDGTQAADPASEQIMVQQYDRQEFHDSGCMMFGPDGYLYYAVGDEGGANDEYHDGQKINDRLFSGIMRLDVDQNLTRSHAIRRQPAQLTLPAGWPKSFTANYTIPNDNPFVNPAATNLEEFYAIGFRQPYRFSYDAVSNRIWVGESGQDTQEELDILTPGSNYGWPFREGAVPGPQAQPATLIGTLREPVWSIPHGPDGCVVGGFVYRGAAFPDLTGRYITVDNVSGRIRAFNFDGTKATDEILTSMPSGSVYSGTSTVGRDAAGEPIFIKINGTDTRGRFFKLAKIPVKNISAAWFRFDDLAATNTSGYVSENPGAATSSEYGSDLTLQPDEDNGGSGNVTYTAGTGLVPSTVAANTHGVRSIAAGNGGARPGNYAGGLYTSSRIGKLDNFTAEISFRPAAGSLAGGYQCFLGVDGTTGVAPLDGEPGVPLQPFRLMRWGRNDPAAMAIPLLDGDLVLNVRTYNTATSAWTSVPVKVADHTQFVTGKWYHLAIVGDVTAGTITVYSYDGSTYTQVGQRNGYIGNLQAGVWSAGRGCYDGGPTDRVANAEFDEVRILDKALTPAQFLYGSAHYAYSRIIIDPPALLSQTGAFTDLATLNPSPGLIPYNVNAPLWSDGAVKYRWIALPNNGTQVAAAEKIGFNPDASWNFPPGTVFIKHFELPVDEAHPEITRRLETRFILMSASGEPYGVTYKWRADGSDADLLAAGENDPVTITEAGGGTHTQTWSYPGPADCRICHNGNASYVLGVKTQQLNGDYTYPATGRTANQLETLAGLGFFDSGYHAEHLPYFLKSSNVADTSASLQDRVRSYVDSNCSQCHRPGGVRALFDARLTTPVAQQGLIRGDLESTLFSPDDRVIVPGDLEHSILHYRHASLGEQKMPPLAKNVVDAKTVSVIEDWIMSLPLAPTLKLTGPATAHGSYTVALHFSEPVTGLTAASLQITGGIVSSLTGSGADYTATVQPARFTTVSLSLAADSVVNAAGKGNYASPTASTVVTDSDLVAWLKFDDGTGTQALDSSDSASHPGTLVGMTANPWVNGRFGSALTFDGSGERVTLTNLATADFTLSFWLRTTSAFPVTDAASGGSALVHADTAGAANDFIVAGTRSGNVNRITFQTGHANGSANSVLQGVSNVTTGQWTHVAVTRAQSSGEMKIYVNGALEGTAPGSTDLLGSNPLISLGGNPLAPASSFTGDLDQFRLHDRVLSAQEIQGLAAEPDPASSYDRWAATVLPGLFHLQDPALDPDHDGISNFGEYAFGTSPLASDIIPVPLQLAADGSITISYPHLKTPGLTSYTVLTSPDLINWQSAAPGLTQVSAIAIPFSNYETVTVKYLPAIPATQLYFRVQATAD
jgi:uncharacterized repeat protein (TIGR03806 family)